MHELSVCRALVAHVEGIARHHRARRIDKVTLRIGPLSGIESALLERAYPLASAGTVAQGAELSIEPMAVRVRCSRCGAESDVEPNRLLCGACGDFRTNLVSGDEMLLASVELTTDER
ncbi:MAG: hydrogenase maturation nickel metallochaperone HypA [Gammaproteobacteria bacterium]|nr:hydrogenase maturation nickel metallochaperone HypA [Gammaproteobacteria bacterium]NIR81740.1 hydrogenase maturation nickel metallochaperone HypA [Gammaproteobacteria bacterium]NIR88543.1 hydrogenase maturation nickel metallochaperone HypA [Gammaproteobacteria bacterium]NIU02847.1 hydrogenase maturation nickel metallochaperone HypA [Gammaproteobacteria bacterium]NIV50369.1 hydrogenase nickel incorporation protein HypA [Gammaproteobacteria bacterium]